MPSDVALAPGRMTRQPRQTSMKQRYHKQTVDRADLLKAIAAIHRYGYDPAMFLIQALTLRDGEGTWDRWGAEGLVEVSTTFPVRHTEFYKPASGRWLSDFERD